MPPPGAIEIQKECFAEIQTVLVAAGIVCSILWPKPLPSRTGAQRSASVRRGKRLRAALAVPDTSALNSRVLRNAVEHIDERFEDHDAKFGAGPYGDFTLVLRSGPDYVFPTAHARGFVRYRNELWMFGERGDLQKIALGLWDLLDRITVSVGFEGSPG